MIPDKCSHGVTWKVHCVECEYISDLETIRMFAPMVDNAMRRVNQYNLDKDWRSNQQSIDHPSFKPKA